MVMKAKDLLERYAKGERNFRNVDIRGQSFKGKNLSGADFTNAQIQGTNFSKANLSDTTFSEAKAGLQKRWAILLSIFAIFTSGFFSFLSTVFNYLIIDYFLRKFQFQNNPIIPLAILSILFLIFIACTIRRGLVAGMRALIGPVVLGGLLAWALAGALGVAVAEAGALAGAGAGALGIAVAVAFGFALALARTVVLAGAVVSLILIGLSFYISRRALAGDEKDIFIRDLALNFAGIGGTSFKGANLTDSNFTRALLKSTDFREATLIRVCWTETELELARLGKTYLQSRKMRDLLVTGELMDSTIQSETLTRDQVQTRLAEIKNLIQALDLPSDTQKKALTHLEAAQVEITSAQPDHQDAQTSLQKVNKTLEEVKKASESGSTIWKNIAPITALITKLIEAVWHF